MDGIPKKEKRDKKSIIPKLWHSKEDLPISSEKSELSPSEEKKSKRMINSAPPSLERKTIDQEKKIAIASDQPENMLQNTRLLPAIIATSPRNEVSQLTFEEMLNTDERITRTQDKRSKLSRSLSPAKKDTKKPNEKFSSSDPERSIFRRSPRDKSNINKPTKKTISPQKSPTKNEMPTDFQSALDALHNERVNHIKHFIDIPEQDPNEYDKTGKNTLLHHAVLTAMAKNNPSLVLPFFFNSRVNSLRVNEYGYTPYMLVAGKDIEKYPTLYQSLCKRTQLDHLVNAIIMMTDKLICEPFDDAFMTKQISLLLKEIPHEIIPEYADIEFIITMIKARLKLDNLIIQILHDQYNTDYTYQDKVDDSKVHFAVYVHDTEFLNKLTQADGLIERFLLQALSKGNEPIALLFLTNPLVSTLTGESIDQKAKIFLPNIPSDLRRNLCLRTRLDHIVRALIITNPDCIFDEYEHINQKIKTLVSDMSPDILPNYATDTFIFKMICAELKRDVRNLEQLHKTYKNNPHHQDKWGNSYVHHAVNARDKNIITVLIQNPLISFLQQNSDQLFPQGLLSPLETKMEKIRKMLFMRDSIERWIEKGITRSSGIEGALLLDPVQGISELKIDNPCIQDIIQKVKNECAKVREKQTIHKGTDQDGQLPTSTATLPLYANDEFIYTLIKTRLFMRKSGFQGDFV